MYKIWGHCPLKFGKAINVQTLAPFRTAFQFDRKYLWNSLRYRQAVNFVINYSPFCIEQKNFDELWSTNDEVVFAHFDLPKIHSACVFRQLSTLTANISGKNKDIDKRLTTFSITVDSTLTAVKLVVFGSLTTKLCLLISTYATLRVRAFTDNFRF